ncbi:Holliday junction branch migration protein RuvA [Candidatus Dojkabacteria bacterium]|jgi:Holliday junction DNA helicase RuvA|nr:Holliday junction branch migration protein RuvA [Candidatus Dojkabacteria bacterium]
MISIVSGKVAKVSGSEKYSFVDVLTSLGIGYRIFVSKRSSFNEGANVVLYTSFQVREDNQSLYGFPDMEERDFFELLITVSGIGPKIGLAVLSMYSPSEIVGFILSGDATNLSKVSGLGKKGAGKIVLELENRISGLDIKISDTKVANKLIIRELKEALQSLGFKGEALKSYLEKGEKLSKDVTELDQLLKLVLKHD